LYYIKANDRKKIIIGIIYLIIYRIIADSTFILMGIQIGGDTPATLFYPAVGVTIAFIMYFGMYIIPLTAIDIFISTIEHGRAWYIVLGLPIITLIVYGTVGLILKRYMKDNTNFKNLKDSIIFLVTTASGAFLVGLSFGLILSLYGTLEKANLLSFSINWFIGDIIGIYSMTPLLLIIIYPFFDNMISKKDFPAVLSSISKNTSVNFIIVSVFTSIIFLQSFYVPQTLFFLFFIPLTSIALKQGLKGAIITNNIIIVEVVLILKYLINDSIFEFQLIIFSLSSVALIIGVVINERDEYLNELQYQNFKIEEIVKKRTLDLENANQDLKYFNYAVSHDLRSPLVVINSLTDLIINEFQSNQKGFEIANKLKSKTSDMELLIENLLNFFSMSQQSVNKKNYDMKSIIESVYNSIVGKENNKNIKLVIENDIPEVYGDYSLLNIVWSNLISNAIKFSSKKESPIITIGSQTDKSGRTIYYIKDNGIGFEMKDAKKIFDVFQRLNTSNEYKGTGIGLALVKKIIEKHGGEIWVTSKPNQGASFYFTIAPKLLNN
jgi:signal transduction histidine kinase